MRLYHRSRPAGHPDLLHPTRGLVPAHSWTLNFLLFLQAPGFGPGTGLTDITNVVRPWDSGVQHFDPLAADYDDSLGIIVGNGPTPPNIASWVLPDPIPNGDAAGELLYLEQARAALRFVGYPHGAALVFERTLVGNAVQDELANQMALYCSDGTYTYMMIVDALASPISFPQGLTTTVQYVISTSIQT